MGSATKNEREFLAFYWEATVPEKPGTGCISHSTRVALIDAALGYLNCLGSSAGAKYRSEKEILLLLRKAHQDASGKPATAAPAKCSRPR